MKYYDLLFVKYLSAAVMLLAHFPVAAQNASDDSLQQTLDTYNVKWQGQSKNSSESMPLGGGDMGLNVWVEEGQVRFYISRSGTFDENNQFLKLGRVRLELRPNIFQDPDCEFTQELKLYDGYIRIIGKKGDEKTVITLWVDVHRPIINVKVRSDKEVNATAFYDSWRTEARELPMEERHAAFSYTGYPGKVITYPDSIAYKDQGVQWHHRNRDDHLLFDYAVKQQGMEGVKHQMVNPQKDLTFGGRMVGANMAPSEKGTGTYSDTSYTYWSLASKAPAKQHSLKIVLHTDRSPSLDHWENGLANLYTKPYEPISAWERTKKWWRAFWRRSHIFINTDKNDPNDKGWQVGRNYQLFRYMLGCNAYGAYPTKFNGGLFTTDPQYEQWQGKPRRGTPDFRAWGGGSFTAQNQRLVYWPMLKSGDFDMMPPQFRFYSNVLKNAELRSKVYWGHGGACFTEQTENFGLPFAGGWGFGSGPREREPGTPFGEQTNPHVKHHYTTQLEFAYIILKYHEYTGYDISEYLPFVKSATDFFFEHYRYRNKKRSGNPLDENGKLVLYPSTAAETYKNVKNPTDLCAALRAVTERLVRLPDGYLSKSERKKWQERLDQIPPLTYGSVSGHRILVPADSLPEPINVEIMELYPVFPYELYGLGHPDLGTALNTWRYGNLNKGHVSWHQDGIFCARMGLTDEAQRMAVLKLGDGPRRFPAFWGPGHDYVPDHNWGGSGMIGLQDMLVQFPRGKIMPFPAWPEEWDVDFKLHGPKGTTVKGTFKNGEAVRTEISPKKRAADRIEPKPTEKD